MDADGVAEKLREMIPRGAGSRCFSEPDTRVTSGGYRY